jgi:hypothetical protein
LLFTAKRLQLAITDNSVAISGTQLSTFTITTKKAAGNWPSQRVFGMRGLRALGKSPKAGSWLRLAAEASATVIGTEA